MSTDFALPGPEVPVVDENRLLSEFGGDASILAELRDLFLEHAPPMYRELETALAAGDSETLAATAHTFKGACLTYGATRLAEVCKEVERIAKTGDLAAVSSVFYHVQEEYDQVCEVLSAVSV